MKKVKYAIVGYGHRGKLLGDLLKNPEFRGEVVAVVEPNQDRAAKAKEDWSLTDDRVFCDIDAFCEGDKIVDAVINTTQDREHLYTALEILKKGYHMLIEKPVGITYKECEMIYDAYRSSGAMVGVCHSLRYHPMYQTILRILREGKLGELVTLDQIEGVGNIHYSHSYVRGNWSNAGKSSFMLLAKSCHDMDVISYLVGKPCKQVSSFGGLKYFCAANKPEGAPQYCLDSCPHEETCPYSARKVYLDDTKWRFVFKDQDKESVYRALMDGPYGRCVYQCDNNVVDHQVVNLEFEGGVTATFTMTPFAKEGRVIRLGCTNGYIHGDFERRTVQVHRFDTGTTEDIALPPALYASHGGGDAILLESFTKAVASGDPKWIRTTMEDTLISHKITFAAETARRENRVVVI